MTTVPLLLGQLGDKWRGEKLLMSVLMALEITWINRYLSEHIYISESDKKSGQGMTTLSSLLLLGSNVRETDKYRKQSTRL